MKNCSDSLSTINIGGYPIQCTSSEELASWILATIKLNEKKVIFFANTNFIVKCKNIHYKINNKAIWIVNDGIGLDIASWLVYRKSFQENMNGTDFIPYLISRHGGLLKLYLFGAKPDVARRAGKWLKSHYNVSVVGVRDGYQEAADSTSVIRDINASGANIVLIALGNPRQEHWILDNRCQLQPNVLIGVGALFDFLAGDKIRAPLLIRKLRLEWLFRLVLEPSRLIRRYTIDIVVFLFICLRRGKSIK